jgi:elongator complex protein 3
MNERAANRIVGLTLETRPDYLDEKEIANFRQLGATKVEIGVQAIDDKILKHNQRGGSVADIIRATKLLKQAGFKVTYHLMPNLPLATMVKDLKMYEQLFRDDRFQPDMIKIYPTVVIAGTKLEKDWHAGNYSPYSDKQLTNLLLKMKLATPEYVRITRLIRDIPEESILAGNKISNLRQELQKILLAENKFCRCIRCREAREKIIPANLKFSVLKYPASDGEEYFLQFTSPDKKTLFAFLRLRINNTFKHFIPELAGAAIIREVHTYGKLLPFNETAKNASQHRGLGKQLIAKAEEIARELNIRKMAVISGVGVRGYYRKLGYRQKGTYLIKKINLK